MGNETVKHVLLECPLYQDERSWMRNALSNRGIALRCDELLTRPEARTIVTDYMLKTGLLDQFQGVDPMALGMEKDDEKG